MTIKLVTVVEATTVNAVAKNVFEFHRAAGDLKQIGSGAPVFEVSVVTFDRRNPAASESPNEFVAAARRLGLQIDVIPEKSRFDLSVIPALRKIVKRRAADILVTHQVKSHFLIRLSRLSKHYPWVAFHHGYTTTDRKMRAYNHLNRWSLPSADRVITVCEAFAWELEIAGVSRGRIHVQHNSIRPQSGASAEAVEALRHRLAVATDERIILSIGRLSREKAHIDLLTALKHLRDVNPEIRARLVLVGEGPERVKLEAATESLGLTGRVVFAGQVSDVQPYYAVADVLALPSHTEGSPYVLLEAMAANLPVVATAVGGVPEMVEDNKSALLVAASDPLAMAAAIARTLTDPELAGKLTANASMLVATRYSPETYVRSLLGVYREVFKSGLPGQQH